MIKFKIITDSTSGITPAMAKEIGVKVLPLTLHYKNKDYLDSVNISTDEFYSMLFEQTERRLFFGSSNKEFPKTSQVPPIMFKEAYEECIKNGEIPVVFTIASVLSGTYQSACVARDMFPDNQICVFDSKTALVPMRIMVETINSKEYETLDDLIAEANYMIEHSAFFAVPDTLEYLYKGGRLSKTSAVLGNLLQLKPIIKLSEAGKLEPIAKVRGLKAAFKRIAEYVKENPIDDRYAVGFGYSTDLENVNELKEYCKDLVKDTSEPTQISPVIGAHVGPKACGIFYISTKSKKEN